MQNELLSSENFHHRNRNSLQMTEECQNILKDLFDDSKYKISTESMESMEEIIDNTENIYQNDDYSNYNYNNDNNLAQSYWNSNHNPWLVNNLEEFTKLYYCCPECDVIERSKGGRFLKKNLKICFSLLSRQHLNF